jgi:predicted nucleotide-binding protein
MLSEYEKWLKRSWKDYSFIKRQKKFGQRLLGKWNRVAWHTDRITLIHNFTEGKPSIEDFASFLKDAARFYNQYDGNYEIDGAFFVVYEEYDKEAFKLLLRKSDVKDIVKIKTFAKSLSKSRDSAPSKGIGTKQRKEVFIVHGRDKTPALELARLIEKRFPIDAIFLEDEPHRGRTLIEKLEDYSNVDFAFITLTPDDMGALKGERLRERGRQNVIFELGQFIGKIGRKNCCLLIKGDIEIPSDLQGIGYYRFYKKVKECFIDLEKELREAKLI